MLKQALIKSLHAFSGFVPLNFLISLSGQRLLSIFYHTVSDQELPHIKHLYRVRSSQLFSEDLDYLLKHYTPIDLAQLVEHVYQDKALPKNALFLTFDDGLSECFGVIAPILKKKGIPATFFLNSDFIDNKALMFRYKASLLIETLEHQKTDDDFLKTLFQNYRLKYQSPKESLLKVRWTDAFLLDQLAEKIGLDFNAFLKEKTPYLSSSQIQQMLQDGFSFGSHSQNHPTYNSISETEQFNQTFACQFFLEEHFKLHYRTFAFPFTDFGVSKSFFDNILGMNKIQLSFGGAGLKKERIKGQLQRFGMETQQLSSARQLVHSEYCYYIIKSLFGKNTIIRQ